MKLALFSDLHIEFERGSVWLPPDLDVDVILLAGDIGILPTSLEWAKRIFQGDGRRVVYVAGNHEYYGTRFNPIDGLPTEIDVAGIDLLERDTLVLPGLRILGSTLWSGFDHHGTDKVDLSMAIARNSINDYRLIRGVGNQRLDPQVTLSIHTKSVQWLDLELAKPFEGKTVVMTHFAPHRKCVAPQFEGDPLSPYFVTDLEWLMEKHPIDLWCYGHTHSNIEFVAGNGCRVVSNQRGYMHENCEGFRPDRVVEL